MALGTPGGSIMRHALVLGLVAIAMFGREQAVAQERGVVPLKATIAKIHEDGLDLLPTDRIEGPNGQPVRFDVVKDTRFEEVDVKIVDGKVQLQRKAIKLGDLAPTQPITVLAILVGNRPTVLVGIVDGGKISGVEALKRIVQLGGTVRNLAWNKDERTVYHVDLSDSEVADDDLLLIASLNDLATLRLSNTKVTDKGIAYLAEHRGLSSLMLSGTRITNAALKSLAKMGLNQVAVDRTDVTRDAILRFAKQQGLSGFCQIGAGPKGEYRVYEQVMPDQGERSPYVYLMKRDVYHARFYTEGPDRRKATTYYHRDGPVGAVLRRFEWFPPEGADDHRSDVRLPASLLGLSAAPVGTLPMEALAALWTEPALCVVELNGGTMAAYGRPFQTIDFFNDVPEIARFDVKVDGKEPPFGYIEDARRRGTNVRVTEGPFAKTVRKEAPRGFYAAVFVDITVQQRRDPKALKKEDVHHELMTQEALRDLMDRTAPGGVVCFHTSHRSHDFCKPLAAAAGALEFSWKRVSDNTYDANAKRNIVDGSHYGSEWLIVARSSEELANFRTEKTRTSNMTWNVPRPNQAPAWRDGVEPEMPIRFED
jgi:hypothetical protein